MSTVLLTAEQAALEVLKIIGSPGGLSFIAAKVAEWQQRQAKLDAAVAAEKDAPAPGLAGRN